MIAVSPPLIRDLAAARKDNLPANVFLSAVQCRWRRWGGPHFLHSALTYSRTSHHCTGDGEVLLNR